MSNKTIKEIDYLSEDQPISSQKYALISIVGPHMKQKCNVWGLKIRGVSDSLNSSKQLAKKIMRMDKDYDIYTVEVGKFFPLAVEPYDVKNVEYENEQLNSLIKNYLENKELANEHYYERKETMKKAAILDSLKNKELENTQKEHPIAVFKRKLDFEQKINKLKDELSALESDLTFTSQKLNQYSQEEQDEAQKLLQPNVNEQAQLEQQNEQSEQSEQGEQSELVNENEVKLIEDTIKELQTIDDEINEVKNSLLKTNEEHSPTLFNKLNNDLNRLNESKELLKNKISNPDLINRYMKHSQKELNPEIHSVFE